MVLKELITCEEEEAKKTFLKEVSNGSSAAIDWKYTAALSITSIQR